MFKLKLIQLGKTSNWFLMFFSLYYCVVLIFRLANWTHRAVEQLSFITLAKFVTCTVSAMYVVKE